MDGTEKGPAEIIADMRAEIDAKEAEVSRLQEALNQPDPKMAEMTGKLRWELADKDQELAGLQSQLSQKSQALAGFQAELGQLKFVDMDGTEKGPAEIIADMRAEIDAKEAEVSRLQEALNQPDPKMAEMTGKLRWELADKDQELAGLQSQLSQKSQALAGFQAELGQLKFVDMDGTEKGPAEIIADMRAEIDAKEAEVAQLQEALNQPDPKMAEMTGKLRWELADKDQELAGLQSQLSQKSQALAGIPGRIGSAQVCRYGWDRKRPRGDHRRNASRD